MLVEIEKSKGRPRPEIANYKCYREFLKEYFEFKNSLRAGFSYRRFSALAGMKSPNYMQLVIQGQRNLSPESAEKIAQALKLTKTETEYFLALVQRQSAKSDSENLRAEKDLFKAAKALKAKFIQQGEVQVFKEWYHFVIRELVFLPDFEPSAEWICERLQHTLSLAQAESSLHFLIQSGFLAFKDGKYQAADPVIDTGTALFQHRILQEYHAKTLKMWAEQLLQAGLGHQRQEVGLVNIPVPSDKIPELQKKIRNFQDEIIGWAQDFKNPEELVQLGTYLMIVAPKKETKDSTT